MLTNYTVRLLYAIRLGMVLVSLASMACPLNGQELRYPAVHVTDAAQHHVGDGQIVLRAASHRSGLGSDEVPLHSEELSSIDVFCGEDYAAETALTGVSGFIDSAVVQSQFRLRFDSASNATFPDRAVFQFAPRSSVLEIDYTDVSGYLEYAIGPRMSVLADVPVRFIEALGTNGVSDSEQGAGDITLGLRYQAFADCHRAVAFQLRFRTPTGVAGDIGNGETNFVNVPIGLAIPRIEPGILFQSQRDERTTLFGEFKVNVPLEDVTDAAGGITQNFAGTVLRYGLGVGYDIFNDCYGEQRLTSLAEFVGWSVLSGLKSNSAGPPIDGEDTIFNIKVGARWTQGNRTLYAGYSRGITDQVWYQDLFRADYTVRF